MAVHPLCSSDLTAGNDSPLAVPLRIHVFLEPLKTVLGASKQTQKENSLLPTMVAEKECCCTAVCKPASPRQTLLHMTAGLLLHPLQQLLLKLGGCTDSSQTHRHRPSNTTHHSCNPRGQQGCATKETAAAAATQTQNRLILQLWRPWMDPFAHAWTVCVQVQACTAAYI